MKDRLVFDTTDTNSIAASDSVGAFVRASDGTLITKTTNGAKEALDVFTELGKAEDSAHVSGNLGAMILAVRRDADTSLVDTDGDYAPLQVDADGFLKVAGKITVEAGDAEYLEDSAHSSGDAGLHILAVRQDTLATSTSDDGDYASLKVNALGRLYVDPGTVTVTDAALANTAIAAAAETLDVANTSQNVVASPLANRKYLWIYNRDNQIAYIGQSGVTSANGFPVSPGSYLELRVGSAVDVEYVSAKLNHEIRTLELS